MCPLVNPLPHVLYFDFCFYFCCFLALKDNLGDILSVAYSVPPPTIAFNASANNSVIIVEILTPLAVTAATLKMQALSNIVNGMGAATLFYNSALPGFSSAFPVDDRIYSSELVFTLVLTASNK